MTKNGEEQKDTNVDKKHDKITTRNNKGVEKAHQKHQGC
jgi:hypothetical protein